MELSAHWIWDGSGERPRNRWACFRRSFEAGPGEVAAECRITADSRYVLYVNGRRIGAGPPRSWPWKLSVDRYDLREALRAGTNQVAVLVRHYGIGTFQYIEGRGGLLAEIVLTDASGVRTVVPTDGRWRTHAHEGYARDTERIAVQQAWTEVFDARRFPEDWTEAGFDDGDWLAATELGRAGMAPWTELRESDAAHLTDEAVAPAAVTSVRTVRPYRWNFTVDLRPTFYPGQPDACLKRFQGLLLTVVHAAVPTRCSLSCSETRDVRCDGMPVAFDGDGLAALRLPPGDHLLVVDASRKDFDVSVDLSLDAAEALSFRAPLSPAETETGAGAGAAHAFGAAGPFHAESIRNGRPGRTPDDDVPRDPVLEAILSAPGEAALAAHRDRIAPVPASDVFLDGPYAQCTLHHGPEPIPVGAPYTALQAAGDPASFLSAHGAPGPEPGEDLELVLDFGTEVSGHLAFDITAPAGAVLDLYGFEGRIDGIVDPTYGLRNTLRYVARDGRQRHRSEIRRGFRYLMLVVRPGGTPVRIHSVHAHACLHPVEETGAFRSSDPALDAIWRMSRDTMRLCMEDTFVDCPAYEQAFWVGDTRIEALVSAYCFGAYGLTARCLALVVDSMDRSDLPESHVPSAWPNVLPAWSFLWVVACREHHLLTGDDAFARRLLPHLATALERAERHLDADGLLSIEAWNMLDWADMDTPDRGVVTHQNCLFAWACAEAAALADALEEPVTADRLRRRAEALRSAVNARLWSERDQAYTDCLRDDGTLSPTLSQQTQLIAYLGGCVPEARLAAVRQRILYPAPDQVVIGTPFLSFFLHEALQRMGRTDAALADIRRRWGRMLGKGATTCWEMFHGWNRSRYTRSHCHAWSAGPAYFLGAHLLGIRPLTPGFGEVLIAPDLQDLTWMEGRVPTPKGAIQVRCALHDGALDLHVRLPAGCRAHLAVPPGRPCRATIETDPAGTEKGDA